MTHYKLKAETGHINFSPTGFRLAAIDYFKCFLDFEKPGRFSVVPYFLCCRAIELALKAMHLETKRQTEVKRQYLHNLVKMYDELSVNRKNFSLEEYTLLKQANETYKAKQFEYVCVLHAMHGYSMFPNLDDLANLARKITGFDTNPKD